MFGAPFIIFETTNGMAVAIRPEAVTGVLEKTKGGPNGGSCAIFIAFSNDPAAVVIGDLSSIVTRLQGRE